MKASFGLVAVLVICQFCNIDFTNIRRHQWWCKSKLNQGEGEQSDGTNMLFGNSKRNSVYKRITLRQRTPVNENHVQCCCGKKCKGLRGLKSHQRSCHTIRGLNGNLVNELQAIDCIESETLVENALSMTTQPFDNTVKKGLNLSTTQGEWEIANSFFHSELPLSEVSKYNLNHVTEIFNRIVYDYFHDNYGTAKKGFEKENELQVKYKDYSKSQLRKELKHLKHNNTDTDVVIVHSLSSGKVEMFLCAACHAFTPHVNAWKR